MFAVDRLVTTESEHFEIIRDDKLLPLPQDIAEDRSP